MLLSKFPLTIILVASAAASPLVGGRDGLPTKPAPGPISIPIKLNIDSVANGGDFVQKEVARARALLSRHKPEQAGVKVARAREGAVDVPVTNGGTMFTAEVGVGTPSKKYNLLLDTGSSNTFLASRAKYQPTSSAKNTSHKTHVKYGSGEFQGYEFSETVTLGDAVITEQLIGISTNDTGLDEIDGLLGLGPEDLTRGTVEGMDVIPTVVDNLVKQGVISNAVLGLSFVPTTGSDPADNSMAFGAPDESKFTGDVTYVPITSQSGVRDFWGIDQSTSYGSVEILPTSAGIVDSGTTLLMLETNAYQAYVNATGAKKDNATGLLKLDDVDSLKSLFFHIGETTREFTANAQMWPHSLNTAVGGDSNATYLIVSDLGNSSQSGMTFILGLTFLQRYYSIYDTTNQRIGFATTPYTDATSN